MEQRGISIDRQILKAEEELGAQLFERLPGRLRLTAAGELLLVDVRPADERALATVAAPFRTLDAHERLEIEQLPKDTPLAFLCHHGGRSGQAAEEFRGKGFTHVFNVEGGIDRWAGEVDGSVPRY